MGGGESPSRPSLNRSNLILNRSPETRARPKANRVTHTLRARPPYRPAPRRCSRSGRSGCLLPAAMAGVVQRVTALAKQMEPQLKTATAQVAKFYDATLAANAEYIVKDKEASRKLGSQWFYTRLAE